MGNLDRKRKIGNLDDPRMPYDYATREYGTVPPDNKRQPFRWVSEVAYKNVHRIVARGYDTTELMEQGYGVVDVLFVDFQARIPLIEEEKMLNYLMILGLEDGLSMPAQMARLVARSKTFLTQACGASILAFGHAYGAYSSFGNRLNDYLEQAEAEGKSIEEMAKRCLSCTACTQVCPSCQSFTIEDEPNIDLKSGTRIRLWDSCQLQDYTKIAGDIIFRPTRLQRTRQRIMCKLRYSLKREGLMSCTGCGRCVDVCPKDINMFEALK